MTYELREIANTELAIIENESEFITSNTQVDVIEDDEHTLIVYGTIGAFNAYLRIVVVMGNDGNHTTSAHIKYDVEGGWWEEI